MCHVPNRGRGRGVRGDRATTLSYLRETIRATFVSNPECQRVVHCDEDAILGYNFYQVFKDNNMQILYVRSCYNTVPWMQKSQNPRDTRRFAQGQASTFCPGNVIPSNVQYAQHERRKRRGQNAESQSAVRCGCGTPHATSETPQSTPKCSSSC